MKRQASLTLVTNTVSKHQVSNRDRPDNGETSAQVLRPKANSPLIIRSKIFLAFFNIQGNCVFFYYNGLVITMQYLLIQQHCSLAWRILPVPLIKNKSFYPFVVFFILKFNIPIRRQSGVYALEFMISRANLLKSPKCSVMIFQTISQSTFL